jgi:hypothetical protein
LAKRDEVSEALPLQTLSHTSAGKLYPVLSAEVIIRPKVVAEFCRYSKGLTGICNAIIEPKMTFKTEMDVFFIRNCYSQSERSKIKSCRQYQLAEEINDFVHAQEIAMQVVEGKISNLTE